MASQFKNVHEITGGVIAGLDYLGIATASPAAIPMMAAIGSAPGIGIGAIKVGDALAEQIAPHTYHKHIGKIK